jgi:LPXTG-motif cell wall-anchored protein
MKIILIVILLAVSIITAFAQSLITFDVDTTKFAPGEIVELKGKVNGGLEGQPVAVEIKDADGNVMLIRTVTSDENGNFVLKFKVPNDAKAGEFNIVTSVELDGQSFSETKSVESVASTPDPEATSSPTQPPPTVSSGTQDQSIFTILGIIVVIGIVVGVIIMKRRKLSTISGGIQTDDT